ncbi:MAG: single-stranded-DNA-specific exonuclease RecJ, partial [Bacteroidota bacterium]
MEKIWRIKSNPEADEANSLSANDEIGPVIAKLLALRGISTLEEAQAFFNPAIGNLHDPFLMNDMQVAVERLTKAVHNNEHILVYGDYDVDGTTSVALVYSFLSQFHSNIDYYIPDRYDEGYGVSFKGVDYAVEQHVSLIIVLDCGIKAADKIEYARNKGVEFIICDHHTPGNVLPHAVACLDPKRPDCPYPDKNLSGCGVGFKFMQAYSMANEIPVEHLNRFLDLVAVSIASDIVPVTGENRVLADLGLRKLNDSPGTGLKNIIKVAGLTGKPLSLSEVVFKIGPRINAAGRVKSGKAAVELLISDDDGKAGGMSRSINACNETRKDLDRNITNEALRLIAADETQKERKTTVIFQPEWHKGVIGIVASRL